MDGMVSAARLDGEEMVDQRLWPAGEMRERLRALGYSMRAFADEIGEHEQFLRQLDSGRLLTKRANIARRAELFGWLDIEERLRRANPLPVKEGHEAVAGEVKQRRLPRRAGVGSPIGEVEGGGSDLSPLGERGVAQFSDLTTGQLVEPRGAVEIPADASVVDRMMALAGALPLEVPEVPDVRPVGRISRQLTPAEVRRIYDYAGLGPRELARRAGAPELTRDLRRWANREGVVKPDAQVWLERVEEAATSDPEVAGWQRRVYAFHAWRGEIERRLNEVWDRLAGGGPPLERIEEWERRVDSAASNLPHWMRPKPKGQGGAVPNPKGHMTLDEIL